MTPQEEAIHRDLSAAYLIICLQDKLKKANAKILELEKRPSDEAVKELVALHNKLMNRNDELEDKLKKQLRQTRLWFDSSQKKTNRIRYLRKKLNKIVNAFAGENLEELKSSPESEESLSRDDSVNMVDSKTT